MKVLLATLTLLFSSPSLAAEWVYESSVDPMTDKTRHSAVAQDKGALFVVMCEEQEARVGLIADQERRPQVGGSIVYVEHRVDSNKMRMYKWKNFRGYQFGIEGEDAKEIVNDILEGKYRLLVRVGVSLFTFSLDRHREIIADVFDRCSSNN